MHGRETQGRIPLSRLTHSFDHDQIPNFLIMISDVVCFKLFPIYVLLFLFSSRRQNIVRLGRHYSIARIVYRCCPSVDWRRRSSWSSRWSRVFFSVRPRSRSTVVVGSGWRDFGSPHLLCWVPAALEIDGAAPRRRNGSNDCHKIYWYVLKKNGNGRIVFARSNNCNSCCNEKRNKNGNNPEVGSRRWWPEQHGWWVPQD